MDILKREQGVLVVKQFGKVYLRFMAGGISDKLYQMEITQEELNMIMNCEVNCEFVINKYMNKKLSLPEGLEDRLIFDYLSFTTEYSDKRIKVIIDKLHKYGDIFNEFYYFVLKETFEDGVEELGYCASKLFKEYPLSPLGAYNYLIYLRDDPKNALNDLAAGLPRK